VPETEFGAVRDCSLERAGEIYIRSCVRDRPHAHCEVGAAGGAAVTTSGGDQGGAEVPQLTTSATGVRRAS
jgi:hypothetical protein